jgi:hypothetical protein
MDSHNHKLNIQLKYCGGCNPEIDRGLVVKKLEEQMLSEKIHFEYVSDNKEPDILLLVNGCAHACREEELKIPSCSPSLISVKGERIGHETFSEDKIPNILFERIKSQILNQSIPIN